MEVEFKTDDMSNLQTTSDGLLRIRSQEKRVCSDRQEKEEVRQEVGAREYHKDHQCVLEGPRRSAQRRDRNPITGILKSRANAN